MSQITLLVFSAYCTLVPLIRRHQLQIQSFWFCLGLALSVLAGIASVAVYPYNWRASVALGFVSGIAQAISVIQLIEGVNGAIGGVGKESEATHKTL